MTQDLLEKPAPVVDPLTVEPEALIEEARQRARRRRLRTLAAVLALIAIGGGAYWIIRGPGHNSPGVEKHPNGPIVNASAFTGHGTLAFISRGKLWILDGQSGSLHAAPSRFPPTQPLFSPDGKWLAYLQEHNNPASGDGYSRLWIARADGTDAHVVPGPKVHALFGWSPRADQLAVSTGPEHVRQPCPCHSPTELRIVSPDGSSRILARAGWVDGASWSPNGRQLAVAANGFNEAQLIVYPLRGGSGRVWLARHGPQKLNGMNSILFSVAGWWPYLGIGIWVFGDGAVRNADGTPLDAIAAPGAPPTVLGTTLSSDATDPVSASTRGDVAVVVDRGGGREAWRGKQVELCSAATHECRMLPHAPGTATVDPTWLPDGRTLLYGEAPNITSGPWTQTRIAAWFSAHRLLMLDSATGRVRSLPSAHGATAISVAANSKSLLYVRNDALWLLPTLNGTPVRVAAPLFAPHSWPQYYAQVAWSSQFAWSSK
jgi:hypothetical protein